MGLGLRGDVEIAFSAEGAKVMVPGVFGLQNSELFAGVGEGFLGGAGSVVGFQIVDAVLPEGLLAGDEGIDAFLIPIAGEDVGGLKEGAKLRIA